MAGRCRQYGLFYSEVQFYITAVSGSQFMPQHVQYYSNNWNKLSTVYNGPLDSSHMWNQTMELLNLQTSDHNLWHAGLLFDYYDWFINVWRPPPDKKVISEDTIPFVSQISLGSKRWVYNKLSETPLTHQVAFSPSAIKLSIWTSHLIMKESKTNICQRGHYPSPTWRGWRIDLIWFCFF